MRLLYFYKWCTLGGVERILINRAFAFKQHNIDVKMDIFFFYGGKIDYFKRFIREFSLQDHLSVVGEYDVNDYDHIFSIDSEEVFEIDGVDKVILEYHTAYENHGKYIYKAPRDKIHYVLVPSEYFKEVLQQKRQDLKDSIFVVRNFVKDIEDKNDYYLPRWKLKPILSIGRIDELKDPYFLVEAVKTYNERMKDELFLCLVGSSLEEERFLSFVEKKNMLSRVVWYPGLGFDRVISFLKLMKERGAIFASTSKGESFGMSAAEAIYNGMPALLSNIKAHSDLVEGDEKFLYKTGSINDFMEKLEFIIKNYSGCSKAIEHYKPKLSEQVFLEDWRNFSKILE